jgi:hypothetical protein
VAAHHRVPEEEPRKLTDLVAEALELRRWTVALLARDADPHAAVQGLPRVSPAAWRLFLAAEVIALPLSRRLGDSAAQLPPDARDALDAATSAEMQRVLAVRAQLADIDRIADTLGVEPVVLKGAVAAVDGDSPVDMGDIDLLARSFDAPGLMPVEFHEKLDVGYGLTSLGDASSMRLPGFRRLRRLTPVAHILYCLQHATTHHVVRRGHLRDVVLVANALERCTEEEQREVDAAISTSPAAPAYRASLGFSRTMRDPFELIAAAKYEMAVRWPGGAGPLFPLRLHHVPFFVASGDDGWRIIRSYLAGGVATDSRWYSTTIARRAPQLARWIAIVVRTPYRVVALAAAWVAARGITRRYSTR